MSTICKFISKRDGGALSIIYNAGINKAALTKTSQRHDIETVNVPATCDKLLTAVTQRTQQTEPHISYRVMSTLCYGALRIHRQQVNFLLDLSKNLLARSCDVLCSDIYTAIKRKSSTSVEQMISTSKKRRLSVTYKQQQHKQVKKFTGLLDEMEALIKWSQMQICLPEETTLEHIKNGNDLSVKYAPQKRRIHVRELTLRQYSAEIETPATVEEECGFGNATEAEIKTFMDYFKHNDNNSKSFNDRKRKAVAEHLCYEKVSKDSFDATIEVARCLPSTLQYEDNANNNDTIPLDGKAINNTDTISMLDLSDRQRTYTTNFLVDNVNIAEFASQEHTIITSTPISLATLTPSSPLGNETDMRNGNRKRKSVDKLIFDECIMFTEMEMKAQMLATGKRLCVQLPQPKVPNANELLQRLPMRFLTPRIKCHALGKRKPKRKADTSTQSETEYLQLLREIVLPLAMNDQLAGSVYEKWQHQQTKTTQRLKHTRTPMLQPADINHNDLAGSHNQQEHACAASAVPGTPWDWSPYGVMMQLTDIWRHATVDEIDAKAFLLNTKSRMNAASAFGSLLVLAGKKFINISKYATNLQMHKINLGTASERLLEDLQQCENAD